MKVIYLTKTLLVVDLEKVVFREGNCQGNRKLQADPA